MRTIAIASAAVATLAVAAIAHDAGAVGLLSTTGTGPAGNCQAALPAFEGTIRKRPLAVANEGTTGAYVTCAFSTEEVSLNLQQFQTRVTNLNAEDATIACTAVIGDELGSPAYVTKSAEIDPGASTNLVWNSTDTPGLLLTDSIAISCLLPPGVALNRNSVTTLVSLL